MTIVTKGFYVSSPRFFKYFCIGISEFSQSVRISFPSRPLVCAFVGQLGSSLCRCFVFHSPCSRPLRLRFQTSCLQTSSIKSAAERQTSKSVESRQVAAPAQRKKKRLAVQSRVMHAACLSRMCCMLLHEECWECMGCAQPPSSAVSPYSGSKPLARSWISLLLLRHQQQRHLAESTGRHYHVHDLNSVKTTNTPPHAGLDSAVRWTSSASCSFEKRH